MQRWIDVKLNCFKTVLRKGNKMIKGIKFKKAMLESILILNVFEKMKPFLVKNGKILLRNNITVFLGKKLFNNLQMMLQVRQNLSKKQSVFSKSLFLMSKGQKYGLSFSKTNLELQIHFLLNLFNAKKKIPFKNMSNLKSTEILWDRLIVNFNYRIERLWAQMSNKFYNFFIY